MLDIHLRYINLFPLNKYIFKHKIHVGITDMVVFICLYKIFILFMFWSLNIKYSITSAKKERQITTSTVISKHGHT